MFQIYDAVPCSQWGYCEEHSINDLDPFQRQYVTSTGVFGIAYALERPRARNNPRVPNYAPFEHVPVEIVKLIATYLDPRSLVCMALSNKYLYQCIPIKETKLVPSPVDNDQGLPSLLQLLQRDVGEDYFLCNSHRQLRHRLARVTESCCLRILEGQHTADRQDGCWNRTRILWGHPSRRMPSDFRESLTPIYKVSLLHIHQILQHGLCKKTLECKSHWLRPHPDHTNWEQASRKSRPVPDFPFIHDGGMVPIERDIVVTQHVSSFVSLETGHLILQTKYSFGRRGYFDLREAIMDMDFPVCNHTRIGHPRPSKQSIFRRMLPWDRVERVAIAEHNATWVGGLHKCKFCPTEFLLLREQIAHCHSRGRGCEHVAVDGTNNARIELRIWQDCGDGGYPFDYNWLKLIQKRPLKVFMDESPPGDIKRAHSVARRASSRRTSCQH